MEIEQIVSTLREKVGTTNLSNQTITSLINPLVPKEGEPTEEFFNTTSAWLKTLGGNFSHDVAQQVTTQLDSKVAAKIEEFKKGYKPEAPKTIEDLMKILGVEQKVETQVKSIDELLKIVQGQQQQQQGPGMEEILKAIQASQKPDPKIEELANQVKALVEENNRIKNQANYEGMVKSVIEKASVLNVMDTPLWEHAVSLVPREDGMTEDKMLSLTKAKFEELTKILRPAGTKPYGDGQPGSGNSYLEKFLKERSERDAIKAKNREEFMKRAK